MRAGGKKERTVKWSIVAEGNHHSKECFTMLANKDEEAEEEEEETLKGLSQI